MSTNRSCTAARLIAQAVCAEALESRTLLSVAPAPTAPPSEVIDKVDNHLYQVAVDVLRRAENPWVRGGLVRVDAANRIETLLSTASWPGLVEPELRRL